MPLELLELSLAAHRRRRVLWILARGAALVVAQALIATLILAWIGNALEYRATAMRGLGALFWGSVALASGLLLGVPWLRLSTARLVRILERRVPALRGRLQTWLEQTRVEPASPLLPLLAQDTQICVEANPPSRLWPVPWMAGALVSASLAAGALAWLASGAGDWGEGARRLWALGWGHPEPVLEVLPGDGRIARGSAFVVRARVEGFRPAEATIHVRPSPDAPEESATMRSGDGAFEFRFAAVDRAFAYRVSAGGLSSDGYRVSVVEPPRLESARLRYVYPAWAHREDAEVEGAEDIRVLRGTRVELEVVTSPPLASGVLVVGDQELALEVDGARARAGFLVDAEGRYHVAADVSGERVRMTRDFAIEVVPDMAPSVEIVRPGRDRRATSIEEVTTRVRARDDVHLESVELHYAVNGGAWRRERLASGAPDLDASHLLALEDLHAPGLVPGDVISYYALARDHESATRTEMYFIEVAPFDMRYVQSQQAPGQGGAGGGDEISRRQRQLVIATWNLVRADAVGGEEARRRADLLARLQETLLEQTRTLVDRIRARGMGRGDESVGGFVTDLVGAADSMGRAAALLREPSLEAALEPEQRALQQLLRAEASLRERQVSLDASNGAGEGGGRQDLEELIELELDARKNVYELASREQPLGGAEDPQQDEAFSELERLARRQQELADSLRRSPQPTLAQRWQQETLRRESEQLQRRLESRSDPGSRELARRLDAASRAMSGALRAWDDPNDPSPQGAERASRDLQAALQTARRQASRQVETAVADLARRAEDLVEAQRATAADLVRQMAPELDAEGGGPFFGRDPSSGERDLARERRGLRERVVRMGLDAGALAAELEQRGPEAARILRQAVADLEESQVREQMAFTEELVERGGASFVLGVDQDTVRSLEAFRDAAQEARSRAVDLPIPSRDRDSELARAFRQLRGRLEDAAQRSGLPDVSSGGAPPRDVRWVPPPRWSDLDPATSASLRDTLVETAREAGELRGRMPSGVQRSALPTLSAGSLRSGRELAAGYRAAIVELEQLELEARQLAAAADASGPRTSGSAQEVIDRQGVAEYYRSLSEQSSRASSRAD